MGLVAFNNLARSAVKLYRTIEQYGDNGYHWVKRAFWHVDIQIAWHVAPIVLVVHLPRYNLAVANYPHAVNLVHQSLNFYRAIGLIWQIEIEYVASLVQSGVTLEVLVRYSGTRVVNGLLVLLCPTSKLL